MGRSADSPRQLGIALGAIGASDQFHILMGGHPTVFVKKQEGGPCDHLTLSKPDGWVQEERERLGGARVVTTLPYQNN